MDDSGGLKRDAPQTPRKQHKGSIRDVGITRDDAFDSQRAKVKGRIVKRRPSLPTLNSDALSTGFLPGIQLSHEELDAVSTQPASPWDSPQRQSTQDRPLANRSKSSEADVPKPKKVQSRLRTRTLDNGAQSRGSRIDITQNRRITSADNYVRSESNDSGMPLGVYDHNGDSPQIPGRGINLSRKTRLSPSNTSNRLIYALDTQDTEFSPTPVPTWDPDVMLSAMTRTRGRMQGYARVRWSTSSDWIRTYCCINETSGSLIYENPSGSSMDNILISDLRGCQVRASPDPTYQTRVLHIRSSGEKGVLFLFPASEVEFGDWFAAVLCWQSLLQHQSPGGRRLQDQRATPSRRQSRSSWNSLLNKDATIIKVGKMHILTMGHLEMEFRSFTASSATQNDDFSSKSKWMEVSCVLKDNGKLKVYVPNNATVVSVVRLSKLPRIAIQRLDPSAFDTEYCIAIYPQYAHSASASSQLRPIVLSFESRVLQEVWYVLFRAFTTTAVHGCQQSITADSLQSSELLPGLSRKSGTTVDFRLERSLTVQINEVKFKRRTLESTEGSEETDYVIELLNKSSSGAYYVEVLLDGQIRAKTSIKYSADNRPSWYEKFDLSELPKSHAIATIIVRRREPKRHQSLPKSPKSSEFGFITPISMDDVINQEDYTCGETHIELDKLTISGSPEKWVLFSSLGEDVGEVKAKLAVENAVILFDHEYQQLSEILHNFASGLTIKIAERAHNELFRVAEYLLNIFQVSEKASEWLQSLAEEEIDGIQGEAPLRRKRFAKRLGSNESTDSEFSSAAREATVRDMTKAANADVSLLFRGNTLFTKAMDIHMKRLGREYLAETIGDKMRQICMDDLDCEVDPNRAGPQHDYAKSRTQLLALTGEVWTLIYSSASRCPTELRMILRHVRACAEARYGDLSRSVKYSSVSGFLFLRFFCPAIFSPHLFCLVKETPNPRAHRTFTLIAKTLQALANMISLGQKEPWMEPMNQFLVKHRQDFKTFIDSICSVPPHQRAPQPSPSYSTPLAIFTRIPPGAREGFPSLPYLIDHTRNFAALVNLWLESYDAARPPLVNPSATQQRGFPLEGNLMLFHQLCIHIRHRTNECYQAAKTAEEREAKSDGKDNIVQKWAALAQRMQTEPASFWDPAELTALPAFTGAREPRPFSSRGSGMTRRASGGILEEKRPNSRLGSSNASSDAEGGYTTVGALPPASRDGDRSGGEGRGVFGIFGRKKRNF